MKKSVQNRYFCTGDPIFGHVVKIGYFPLYLQKASKSLFPVGNGSRKHANAMLYCFEVWGIRKKSSKPFECSLSAIFEKNLNSSSEECLRIVYSVAEPEAGVAQFDQLPG